MTIMSVFNILSCVCQIVSLINECQQPFGIFCSSIRKSVFVQYLKLIFAEFFLYFFISMSNLTYIAFAICRLSLVGNNVNKFVKFVTDIDIKKLIGVFIILSCCLTIAKPFNYKITDISYEDTEFPRLFYKRSRLSHIKPIIIVLLSANVVYDVFNSILFVIVSLIVDVVLLRKVGQVMQEKEEKMASQIQSSRDKVKKENEASYKKLVKFVVLNSLANVCLKIPSCVTSLNDFRVFIFRFDFSLFENVHLATNSFVFPYTMGYVCELAKVCQVFKKFGHFLFLVSLSLNFFFLKRFDKNFKLAIRKILKINNKKAKS